MKLAFHDFGKLYGIMREVDKESNSLPPLINIKEFESWFSLLTSLVVVIILGALVSTNSGDLSNVVGMSQSMLLYLISGLIGMLGFIVAGLAIMLSTTSNAILNIIVEKSEIKYLISVFASFVYTAVIMVGLIITSLMFYFILGINYRFFTSLYLLSGFLLSYILFFILLYTVSLLGTCINIFIFNYNVTEEEKERGNEIFKSGVGKKGRKGKNRRDRKKIR